MVKIIVFEGTECSGKSTALTIANDLLINKNYKVLVVNKSNNLFDNAVRDVILEYKDNISCLQLFLLMASRYCDKVNTLNKESRYYDYVLLDRYDISLKVFGKMLNIPTCLIDNVCGNNYVNVFKYIYLKVDYNTFKVRSGNEKRLLYNKGTNTKSIFKKKSALFDDFTNECKDKLYTIENVKSIERLRDLLCINMF